ncbi:hypothetical protein PTKIN_Ptkin11bG0146500 [Pterospermum kingtungense]
MSGGAFLRWYKHSRTSIFNWTSKQSDFAKYKDCKNLASLPSSIDALKCLKILNLSGCYKIENLPENLQQVELLDELDLSDTAVRKPPSFIFQFKNLKVLSFKGCKGPPSKLQANLLSLFKVVQRGSKDSIALTLPSFSDLSGNNFMSLPATITRLSKLCFLQLSDCRLLKAVPALLTSLEVMILDGCASLEVFVNPTAVCDLSTCFPYYFPYNFAHTLQKLLKNNNALSILERSLEVISVHGKSTFDMILPGSEIPDWLSHQTDESSIKIALPPNIRNNNQWVGVILCLVFVFAFDDSDAWGGKTIEYKALINNRNGFFSARPFKRKPVMEEHIWLHYFSREKRFPFLSEDNGWENIECNEIELIIGLVSANVKKCGVQILYEKDLEEIEQIIRQLRNSVSATNFGDINEDISTTHGSVEVNASLIKRKCNTIYEEEKEEAELQPKWPKSLSSYWRRNLNSDFPRMLLWFLEDLKAFW